MELEIEALKLLPRSQDHDDSTTSTQLSYQVSEIKLGLQKEIDDLRKEVELQKECNYSQDTEID